MEFDVVVLAKLLSYKRYVDDTYVYVRRKKNIRGMLLEDFNSYHQNPELTVELNPSKCFNTELIREKGSILTRISSFHSWNYNANRNNV